MSSRKLLQQMFGLTLVALLLAACAGGGEPALPEARAGEWRGSAKCGKLAFVVNPDGKSISRVEFTELEGTSNSQSVENLSGGWPIADDGKFALDTLQLLYNITFRGEFSQDATRATGTWEMPSGCSSKWEATKSQ